MQNMDLQVLHARACASVEKIAQDILGQPYVAEDKGSDGLDLVTSVDLSMQKRLTAELAAILPGSVVVGEEDYAAAQTDAPVWLVDPLDGTVNFVAGLPAYSVAVVLLGPDGPQLSVVYDAPRVMTYSAIKGAGAFLNGAPLMSTNHKARLAVASSGLLKDLSTNAPDALTDLLDNYKLRNFGSQALHLCYAAAGSVRAVASREAKGWDDLAGALIATEAGLRYGTYSNQSQTDRDIDQDQFSLCASKADFDDLAMLFERSL